MFAREHTLLAKWMVSVELLIGFPRKTPLLGQGVSDMWECHLVAALGSTVIIISVMNGRPMNVLFAPDTGPIEDQQSPFLAWPGGQKCEL